MPEFLEVKLSTQPYELSLGNISSEKFRFITLKDAQLSKLLMYQVTNCWPDSQISFTQNIVASMQNNCILFAVQYNLNFYFAPSKVQ